MKRYILIILAAIAFCGYAKADQAVVDGVKVSNLAIEKEYNTLNVDMVLDLKELDVPKNRAVVITPRLVNGRDSLDLTSVTIYGRKRYIYYQRNETAIGGDGEMAYQSKDAPETVTYSESVDYQPWMNGSKLVVERRDYGCCSNIEKDQLGALGGYREYTYEPKFAFVTPVAEPAKNRELKGQAFIDFVVSTTDIRPTYRENKREIAKILATIDSVKNDSDITVKSISIKGFASPESPYSNNTRLAKGRTKALCDYVSELYNFPEGFIKTSYEPEDWEGLRRYVDASSLEHRKQILDIIDSKREPDNKEWYLKSTYPDEYKFLLHNCYPALRHSDYKIDYTIRNYSDVEEIKRVMKERPQKLSLNELFMAARTYEPGSDDYNEVFEVAVRMFPEDATANLNAANTAMSKGDMKAAERYLAKAGNSPEAEYARGIYKALNKDYVGAAAIFESVKGSVPQAKATLDELREYDLIK